MHTTKYILAGIIAAITTNAMATGENTVTSKSYVDAQDALKQDLIDTDMVTFSNGKGLSVELPALVSYDDTNGLTGDTVGLVKSDSMGNYSYDVLGTFVVTGDWWNSMVATDNTVPTSAAVSNLADKLSTDIVYRQFRIPASGYGDIEGEQAYNTNAANDRDSWLSPGVKGTGLVTKTDTDGRVGERSIFEAVDVPAYHDDKLTQTEKDIQDISIPTVGAMMSAISSGITAAAPTGTANTIANYDEKGTLGTGIATYDGSGTYNAATDAGKIATAAAVETKANHMTCAGWPDGVAHTDENCWLWNKNQQIVTPCLTRGLVAIRR